MFESDFEYFNRRAEAELKQAQLAADRRAALAHSEMAKAYLERIAGAPSGRHFEAT